MHAANRAKHLLDCGMPGIDAGVEADLQTEMDQNIRIHRYIMLSNSFTNHWSFLAGDKPRWFLEEVE